MDVAGQRKPLVWLLNGKFPPVPQFPCFQAVLQDDEVMGMKQETERLTAGTRISAQAPRPGPFHGVLPLPPSLPA